MILRNARLILEGRVQDGWEVVVREGKILQLGPAQSGGERAIDLGGNFLAPGFIDLHVHGAMGRDTMESSPEAFRAICGFHASGGTTSLLLTTVTAPIPELVRVLEAIRLFDSPQVLGAHVEGPFISKEKPGAQQTQFIRNPEPALVRELLAAGEMIRQVTLAPELPDALELIERLTSRGIRVSGGHSNAWDEEARAGFERGMRQVTHTFNCMSSARRRGAYRVAGLLEFAMSEPEILCELIADGQHVSPTLMRMLYHAKGVAGIVLVTDATAGAGLPNETEFSLSGLPCVVAEGACFVSDRSTLAGSASRMIDLVRTMVQSVGVSLPEAVQMATANPAAALGLQERKGKIAPGADADCVVFNSNFEVLQTFCGGDEIFAR